MEIPVLSTIDSWSESISKMDDGLWKMCPACREEWSSLRPCQYLSDDHRPITTNVCVQCAETLASFDIVAARSPLAGVNVEVKWSGPRSIPVKVGERIEHAQRPNNAYAVISYGADRFIATSEGTGHFIQFKREGAVGYKKANNVFALWSMIKNQLRNPKDSIANDDLSMDRIKTTRREHSYAD